MTPPQGQSMFEIKLTGDTISGATLPETVLVPSTVMCWGGAGGVVGDVVGDVGRESGGEPGVLAVDGWGGTRVSWGCVEDREVGGTIDKLVRRNSKVVLWLCVHHGTS